MRVRCLYKNLRHNIHRPAEALLRGNVFSPVYIDRGAIDEASVFSKYAVGKDQYLGISDAGIGGRVVVRITYRDNQLKDVEVLEESESEDVGQKAMTELPKQMVAANTVDVDAISGASSSSRALKSAVRNAEEKAKNSVES